MKTTITIPPEAVEAAVATIISEKRTGQLRLNFSQGTPAGGAEWREKDGAGIMSLGRQLSDLTKAS